MTGGFSNLWTDLELINLTYFKSRDLLTKSHLTKPEVRLRSQNKSASLEMTFSAENLQRNYNGSGFSFRPDVLCDVEGKLRNWRKGSRLKKE